MFEALIAPFIFVLVVLALLVAGVIGLVRRRAARAAELDADEPDADTDRRRRRSA